MYENEIAELINKSLPAHVGEVLRKRLERADELEKKVASQALRITALEELNRSAEKNERDAQALINKTADLQKLADELAKKERQFAIDRAVLDALREANCQRMQDHKEIVLAVFANSKYKYDETIQKTVVIPGSNGCSGWKDTAVDRRQVQIEGGVQSPPAV